MCGIEIRCWTEDIHQYDVQICRMTSCHADSQPSRCMHEYIVTVPYFLVPIPFTFAYLIVQSQQWHRTT
jgi:hypothetical protein